MSNNTLYENLIRTPDYTGDPNSMYLNATIDVPRCTATRKLAKTMLISGSDSIEINEKHFKRLIERFCNCTTNQKLFIAMHLNSKNPKVFIRDPENKYDVHNKIMSLKKYMNCMYGNNKFVDLQEQQQVCEKFGSYDNRLPDLIVSIATPGWYAEGRTHATFNNLPSICYLLYDLSKHQTNNVESLIQMLGRLSTTNNGLCDSNGNLITTKENMQTPVFVSNEANIAICQDSFDDKPLNEGAFRTGKFGTQTRTGFQIYNNIQGIENDQRTQRDHVYESLVNYIKTTQPGSDIVESTLVQHMINEGFDTAHGTGRFGHDVYKRTQSGFPCPDTWEEGTYCIYINGRYVWRNGPPPAAHV